MDNFNNDDKGMRVRTIIAFSLSFLLLLGWFYFYKPQTPPSPAKTQQNTVVNTDKTINNNIKTSITPLVSVNKAKAEKSFSITTNKYHLTLTNRGASINSCKYIKRGKEIELVSGKNITGVNGNLNFPIVFQENDFLKSTVLDDAIWDYTQIDDQTVVFSVESSINNSKVIIQKKYAFDPKDEVFKVDYSIKNLSNSVLNLPSGKIIVSAGDYIGPEVKHTSSYNIIEPVYNINGKYKKGSKKGKSEYLTENGSVSYTGILGRYFTVLMIPQGDAKATAFIHDSRKDFGYRTGMIIPVSQINKGATVTFPFKIFLGEKTEERLISIDPVLKGASDVNWFIDPIKRFVLWCLLWIDKFFNNMGWSIILFSLITKFIFLPLTQKSTKSMQKMSELSPKIKEIQEQYKDKPDIMNKKVMEMYKENKVNPMGGCLPLLVQMPFFIALFAALNSSVDLWHTKFGWWITDLSSPDTVATIMGVGVNILPLIWCVTLVVQQKLSTTQAMGQQKVMMMMMPIIMLFFFWSMPSGLLLYWIMQNVLQVGHQLIINSRAKHKKEKKGSKKKK